MSVRSAMVATAIFLGLLAEAQAVEVSPIVLGSTLPLSGDAAVWGKNTQEGIDLATAEINAAGGVLGRTLKVVYADTQGLPREGVSAYLKLTGIDNVSAIIDDSVSGVTLAMAPMADRDHVTIVSTGATSPKISGISKYVFRLWNSDAYEGEVAANYAHDEMKAGSAAILYINNEYGKGLEDVFRKHFVLRGGAVVDTEAFLQNATDMRTQVAKIRAAHPQVVYIVGYPKETPIALRQMNEIGLKAKLLGTVAMQDPQLIQGAGKAAEGLIFPYPEDPTGEQAMQFKQAFRARYGKDPGITSDVGYDAVKMIAKAIAMTGGATGEDIRRGLGMLKDYPGASGTMTFDTNGDVHKPMGMKVAHGDKFIWE